MDPRNRAPLVAGAVLALGLWSARGATPAETVRDGLGSAGGPVAEAVAAAPAERGVRLTLERAIAMARTQSPSALAAIHRYRASYWQYVTFKADYLPSLDLDTAPMALDRTISQQTLPSGIDAFVPRSQANSSANLSLSKVITRTGGRISLQSQIARTSPLEGTGGLQYLSAPVAVSLTQPLFAFNSYAWSLKTEPQRYAEARQNLIEELEGISSTAISYFFDYLSAQTALRDAQAEKAQADTTYAEARRRFARGRTPESDVLQAELASLNADLRLTRARLETRVQQQRLATYLGVAEGPMLDLAPVLEGPVANVDLETAVREARRNRPEAISFDRQLLDADRSVAEARSSRGNTYLTASYGLSRSSDRWSELYQKPQVDQRAQISIHTPILDWGRSRARMAVAESEREVTRRQVERARSDFDRDVFLRVSQFEIQAQQLRLAAHADSVAERRYHLTHQSYLAGQGDLNSINFAQEEKESARRVYLDAIRNYWSSYYDVRRCTLYDFERGAALEAPAVEF
jgi:outer membrane protein